MKILTTKTLILLTFCVTTAFGTPKLDSNAQIVKYEFVPNSGDGSYFFSFLQTDGTERAESGRIKIGQDGEKILEIQGIYKYYNNDGKVVVNYISDENGYREFPESKSDVMTTARPALGEFPETKPPPLTTTTRRPGPSFGQVAFSAAALGSLIGGGLG